MIHTMYKIISGPMVWIAFLIFLGGICFRLWQLYLSVLKKERFILSYMSLKYSLRSIGRWLIPFATLNMRLNPIMTIVSFVFHICLLSVPIFLLSHIVLWEEAWGICWWSIPERLADIMTLVVLAACIFFILRRLTQPQIRYVTTLSDYLLVAMVILPFLTGFYCHYQWPGYSVMMMLHMLSGEILLASIPVTRLSHMIYILFTRSYMGSEFGMVRHARDY